MTNTQNSVYICLFSHNFELPSSLLFSFCGYSIRKCHHIVHILLQITSICKSWAHRNNVHPLKIQTADFLQPGCSHRLTVLSQHISKLLLNCRHQSSSLSEILLCSICLPVSVQPDGKCLKSNLCTLTDHSSQSIYSSLFPFQAISSLISTAFMQLLVSSESSDLKISWPLLHLQRGFNKTPEFHLVGLSRIY